MPAVFGFEQFALTSRVLMNGTKPLTPRSRGSAAGRRSAAAGAVTKIYFPTVVCNTLGVLNALRRDRESLIDF